MIGVKIIYFLLILSFLIISCSEEKFEHVTKVSMIEYNDVGIAKVEIPISESLTSDRCDQIIEQDTFSVVKIAKCSHLPIFEISYPKNDDIALHIKSGITTHEIILTDDDEGIFIFGDTSMFQVEALIVDNEKILRITPPEINAKLIITYKNQTSSELTIQ